MAPSTFGYRACKRAGLISDMKVGRRPTARTVERVREWIARHPAAIGCDQRDALDAAAARDAKDAEAAEIEARRQATLRARMEHIVAAQAREAAQAAASDRRRLGLMVQDALVDGPGDAVRLIRQRWPSLWSRVVQTARQSGDLPGKVLVEAIERGLAA